MTPGARLGRSSLPSGESSLSLRREAAADEVFRLRLFRDSHGGIFAGFDASLVDVLIRQQVAAQAMAYAATHPDARYDIVEHDGLPIGRMVVDRTIDVITLVDIALLAAWRGRGIGGHLLAALLDEAEDARLPVHLSVALDNPARRLYARLGFTTTGVTATHAAMRRDPGTQRAPRAGGPERM